MTPAFPSATLAPKILVRSMGRSILMVGGLICALAARSQAQDASAILATVEKATTSAIAKARPSIVAIARVPKQRQLGNRARIGALQLGRSDVDRLTNGPFRDPDFVPTFFGSGVVLSEDGAIVTCAHVLEDPRQNDYYVWLDKQSYTARLVSQARPATAIAADGFSDLAVLKIDAEGLSPIEYANPDSLEVGKFVIALGNPDAIARDGMASASWGIVSNLSRVAPRELGDGGLPFEDRSSETLHQFGTLIQTDARLNLGTSGGALIDLNGKMLGLTTSLVAKAGDANSAGFAIAADELFQRVVARLRLGKLPEFGFLGIQPEELLESDQRSGITGARVGVVLPGLPGDKAGLQSGDVIFEVGGREVSDRNQLFRELSTIVPGENVSLAVLRSSGSNREKREQHLVAKLSKKPVEKSHLTFTRGTDTQWQGLTVDYATAILTELTRFGIWNARREAPKVVVVGVEPGSVAWDAGLRTGNGIVSVAGQPIHSPDEFHRNVDLASAKARGKSASSIEVRTIQSNGIPMKIWVPIPTASSQ